eukprot:comp7042_c0_seq1/m.7042 comp7042_c0_seq1/g.7042  ORF comp7042_c0_seq1/g.7042 comp7042_c0_seq1/m.7042 type:complete len:357 (-) comp7042_c0_seq1:21-1091(-)
MHGHVVDLGHVFAAQHTQIVAHISRDMRQRDPGQIRQIIENHLRRQNLAPMDQTLLRCRRRPVPLCGALALLVLFRTILFLGALGRQRRARRGSCLVVFLDDFDLQISSSSTSSSTHGGGRGGVSVVDIGVEINRLGRALAQRGSNVAGHNLGDDNVVIARDAADPRCFLARGVAGPRGAVEHRLFANDRNAQILVVHLEQLLDRGVVHACALEIDVARQMPGARAHKLEQLDNPLCLHVLVSAPALDDSSLCDLVRERLGDLRPEPLAHAGAGKQILGVEKAEDLAHRSIVEPVHRAELLAVLDRNTDRESRALDVFGALFLAVAADPGEQADSFAHFLRPCAGMSLYSCIRACV